MKCDNEELWRAWLPTASCIERYYRGEGEEEEDDEDNVECGRAW